MKLSLSAGLAVLTVALSFVSSSYGAGFNIGSHDRSGKCKTVEQWETELRSIRKWSTGKTKFNTVKVFTTNDCDTLKNLAPAAISTKTLVWIGIWNVPNDKYQQEKAALLNAFHAHPNLKDWVAGINVGSESMYRKEIAPADLAKQIKEIKNIVRNPAHNPKKTKILVGTADTWTAWVDGANKPVISAVDVVLMNGFPYWQGVPIEQGLATLKQAIKDTRKAVGYRKKFILGETGWPSAGSNFGQSIPSPKNQQSYWKAAACWLQTTKYQWYWFSAFNEPHKSTGVEKNFGVARAIDRSLKISLKC